MKVTRSWDSLSEFVDYAAGASDMDDMHRTSRRSGGEYTGFHGSKSFAVAEGLAFRWDEGAERVEKFRARFNLKGQKPRRETVMREQGPGVVNMGNFLAGHPQPYAVIKDRADMRNGKGKIVKVMLNVCVSGGVSTKTIEQRGAATLALCDALERAGRRTEIYVAMANVVGKSRIEYVIRVKAAHQKFNLHSLAFAVAHPDMFRRFIFSAMERENADVRSRFNVGGGYGRVGEMENRAEFVYIGGAHLYSMNWDSAPAVDRWIKAEMEKQGIKVA